MPGLTGRAMTILKAKISAAGAEVGIWQEATRIGRNMEGVGRAVQRAKDKPEQLQARAAAVDGLTTSGALDDFTSSDDDIDRQLKQISQSGQVEDELAKLKAEVGSGEKPKEIPS